MTSQFVEYVKDFGIEKGALQVCLFVPHRKFEKGEDMGRIRSQKGFTLVELGIVLMTIYRVIWGAILKGEELITNAKLKRVYNQFRQVLAAAYTY